jgi:mono/diheme cytochrome c family protein
MFRSGALLGVIHRIEFIVEADAAYIVRRSLIREARPRTMTPFRAALISTVAVASVLLTAGAVIAQSSELPEGPGKAIILENCTACHGVEQITAQKRSPEEWGQVVDRMVGNGAALNDEQYKTVVSYLGTYMNSKSTPG